MELNRFLIELSSFIECVMMAEWEEIQTVTQLGKSMFLFNLLINMNFLEFRNAGARIFCGLIKLTSSNSYRLEPKVIIPLFIAILLAFIR